jgi:hypothetical protein
MECVLKWADEAKHITLEILLAVLQETAALD